jgi:uncharacterized membrane protein (UPF0136 family)
MTTPTRSGEFKTPDFTPEAIVSLVLGVISNLVVLFELHLTDPQRGAISGLITTVVLAAFLIHSAVIRSGRARGSALRDK